MERQSNNALAHILHGGCSALNHGRIATAKTKVAEVYKQLCDPFATDPLPPVREMTNETRAAWGARAIPVGNPDHADSMLTTAESEVSGLETSASDTIANILHHLHANGHDTERVIRMAVDNFEAERDGQD